MGGTKSDPTSDELHNFTTDKLKRFDDDHPLHGNSVYQYTSQQDAAKRAAFQILNEEEAEEYKKREQDFLSTHVKEYVDQYQEFMSRYIEITTVTLGRLYDSPNTTTVSYELTWKRKYEPGS